MGVCLKQVPRLLFVENNRIRRYDLFNVGRDHCGQRNENHEYRNRYASGWRFFDTLAGQDGATDHGQGRTFPPGRLCEGWLAMIPDAATVKALRRMKNKVVGLGGAPLVILMTVLES